MEKVNNNSISEKNTNSKKVVGEGVEFDRIRRITGYLVGTVERFNNGKKAEEHDRVKHTYTNTCSCGE